jgi:hypothetical protein
MKKLKYYPRSWEDTPRYSKTRIPRHIFQDTYSKTGIPRMAFDMIKTQEVLVCEDAQSVADNKVKMEVETTEETATVTETGTNYVLRNYPNADWEIPPESVSPPSSSMSCWYSTVKKWRFHKYGKTNSDMKLIIELELNGGTLLRHILYIEQITSIVTKSYTRSSDDTSQIEEVIIDQRHMRGAYNPSQLKIKCATSLNALAFHLSLIDAL